MKNLRLTAFMLSLLFAFSCSSDDDEDGDGSGTLLNTPVAGTVYGDAFEISSSGGKASNILSNEVESVYIYLTAENLGCDAPSGTEFPVTIFTPRAVGTYTNASISFKDPNSTDFVSSSNVTVEIISVGSTVVGRVMGESLSEGNQINGKFEVPYCD